MHLIVTPFYMFVNRPPPPPPHKKSKLIGETLCPHFVNIILQLIAIPVMVTLVSVTNISFHVFQLSFIEQKILLL